MLSYLRNKLFKKDVISDRQEIIRNTLDFPINGCAIKYDHYIEGKLEDLCSEKINCLCVLPNGSIVANFEDRYEMKLSIKLNKWVSLFFPSNKIMYIRPLSNKLIMIFLHSCIYEVWNIQTCKLVGTLPYHHNYILLSDGRIAHSYKNTIYIWNLTAHKDDIILEGHTGCIDDIKQHINDQLLSLSGDHTLCFWDLKTGKCMNIFRLQTGSTPNKIFLLSDGRILIGSTILTIHNENILYTTYSHNRIAHLAILPSPSDEKIVYWDHYGVIWIRDNISQYHIDQYSPRFSGMVVLPDNRILIFDTNNLSIYNTENFRCDMTISGKLTIYDIKVIYKTKQILIVYLDGSLKILN